MTTLDQYELHEMRQLARRHGLDVLRVGFDRDGFARYTVHGLSDRRPVWETPRPASELRDYFRRTTTHRRHKGEPYLRPSEPL